MNIYQRVALHALHSPGKEALIFQEYVYTYKELINKVDNFAYGLNQLGVSNGSRIALFCGNNPEFVITLLAVAKIGAAVAPLPMTLKGQALNNAINGIESEYAIAWSSTAKQLLEKRLVISEKLVTIGKTIGNGVTFEQLQSPPSNNKLISATEFFVSPDNDYILTLTSGSTGSPKPIVFTQATKIRRAFDATINYYQLDESDVVLVSTPMYHSLAQRSVLMPLMLGAKVVILPKFSSTAWFSAVEKYRVTFMFTVSSQLTGLLPELENSPDLSSLKCMVSSSATLSIKDKENLLDKLSCQFHECYGASEVGVITDFDITESNVPLASVGRALPSIKIKICDKNRKTIPCRSIGEIACLTTTGFKGYFNLPEKTQASFDEEGYFYTGDLGYLDEQGYLYFVGRTTEVIKSGGINVYPQDIESVLIKCPQVKECVALGIEDEQFGEVIWVAYVLESTCTKFNELLLAKLALAELTDYQLPRKYIEFTKFPKSALGKILKPEIKLQLQTTNQYK